MTDYRPAPTVGDPRLDREFRRIRDAINGQRLPTLYEAPAKPFQGMVVIADGTQWNPGAGAGPYMYLDSTGWYKL